MEGCAFVNFGNSSGTEEERLFRRLVSKKLRKNCHYLLISRFFFSYRNLPYQAWITHAKFQQRRSNGSGGIRGEADLVKS